MFSPFRTCVARARPLASAVARPLRAQAGQAAVAAPNSAGSLESPSSCIRDAKVADGYLEVQGLAHCGPELARFPLVYLRDNCAENFNPTTNSRKGLLRDLDPDPQVAELTVCDQAKEVRVSWADGHASSYSAHWLERHALTDSARGRRRAQLIDVVPREHWTSADMEENLKTFQWKELMAEDQVLHDWLDEVERRGLAVISDAPQEVGQLQALAERVAFIQTTHYGPTFQVYAKQTPSNLAYTAGELTLHMDLPQTEYVPGVQLLHCVRQARVGGQNVFTDGFRAAEELRKAAPQAYRLLASAPVDFSDIGDDFCSYYYHAQHRTINEDAQGRIHYVALNQMMRSSFADMPADVLKDFYSALLKYNELLNSDHLRFRYRLNGGDIVAFYNYRVLHGRLPYDEATAGGEGGEGAKPTVRHLEGCYFDPASFRSRLRLLKQKLGYLPRAHTNFK